MNKKGFASIAVIIAAVVLIGVLGYIAFSKKTFDQAAEPAPLQTLASDSKMPILTSEPPPAETQDWETFRSKDYGFEVKYPKEWISSTGGIDSRVAGFYYVAFGPRNKVNSGPYVTIKVYPEQTTLGQFVAYFDSLKGIWKDRLLGGNTAKEIIGVGRDSKQYYYAASVQNGFGYTLGSTMFGDTEMNRETAKKMSLTFAFTGQSQTLDWKTYRNDTYGFEFTYPNTKVKIAKTGDTAAGFSARFSSLASDNDIGSGLTIFKNKNLIDEEKSTKYVYAQFAGYSSKYPWDCADYLDPAGVLVRQCSLQDGKDVYSFDFSTGNENILSRQDFDATVKSFHFDR